MYMINWISLTYNILNQRISLETNINYQQGSFTGQKTTVACMKLNCWTKMVGVIYETVISRILRTTLELIKQPKLII